MTDFKDWIELFNLVFAEKNNSVEALFVHGHGDLRDEEIAFVAKLYQEKKPRLIVLNGNDQYLLGEPGVEYFKEQLTSKYKIPAETLRVTKPAKQSLEEAMGFAEVAKQENLKSASIISAPFHIMRAFLTDLEVFQKQQLATVLYPETFSGVDWDKKFVVKSLVDKGQEENTSRLGRLVGEIGRMVSYREKYENGENFPIASVGQGLDYLKKNS